jgi:hypothetical protein
MEGSSHAYIVAYEVGFEGEINWEKPVVFLGGVAGRCHVLPAAQALSGRMRFSGGIVTSLASLPFGDFSRDH